MILEEVEFEVLNDFEYSKDDLKHKYNSSKVHDLSSSILITSFMYRQR